MALFSCLFYYIWAYFSYCSPNSFVCRGFSSIAVVCCKFFFGRLSHEHGNVPAEVLKMDRIREKLKFKMADKNGNGLLDSNEEAARMVLAEHFGDMEPVFIQLFLEGRYNLDFVN